MRTSTSEQTLRLPTSGSVRLSERLGAGGGREGTGRGADAHKRYTDVVIAITVDLLDLERRPTRDYDEQQSSHVLMDGAVADTFDRALAAAMVRAVLVQRRSWCLHL